MRRASTEAPVFWQSQTNEVSDVSKRRGGQRSSNETTPLRRSSWQRRRRLTAAAADGSFLESVSRASRSAEGSRRKGPGNCFHPGSKDLGISPHPGEVRLCEVETRSTPLHPGERIRPRARGSSGRPRAGGRPRSWPRRAWTARSPVCMCIYIYIYIYINTFGL